MNFTRRSATVLLVAVSVLLAGCASADLEVGVSESPTPTSTPSESPTPTPTAVDAASAERPPVESLRFTADGLGDLRIGGPVPTGENAMIVADPGYCTDARAGTDYGILEGDPAALRWRSTYSAADAPDTFSVDVSGDRVVRIDNRSGVIPTDKGIVTGDTLAELLEAHPDVTLLPTSYPGAYTDVYAVHGAGLLLFEVVRDGEAWTDLENIVVYIRVVAEDGHTGAVYGSDHVAGSCL